MSFITPTLLVITTTLPTLLTLYLLHRNAQTFTRPYPALLANLQTKEEFTQAAIYAADKNRLARIKEIYESIKTIAGIFGIVAFMWKNTNNQSEILHSIYFLAAYMLFDTITSLPLTIYSTFGIEEKHGFNKQTVYTFVTDIIKEYIMTIIITAPIVTAIIYAVHWAGDRFYIYIFAFIFVFQIVMMEIYPTFIQPLFNRVEPLPEGELKNKILAMAAKCGYPLKKLFVIDGSRRTSHSNAYLYGFGNNKRIVLFDTLIESCTEAEVISILCHEIGHWKYSHTLSNLFVSNLHLFLLFAGFSSLHASDALFTSFGLPAGSHPTVLGLLLFLQVITPIETIVGFAMRNLSRHFEFQADNYAVQLGYGTELIQGLKRISTKSKAWMCPDALYSAATFSHPGIVERAQAIEAAVQKKQ